MTDAAKFWDRMAGRYSKIPVKDEAAYQEKLETTRGLFTPASRVLELGCGTGTTALHHAPHVQHILATDVSGVMLDIARDKAKAQDIDNVSFEQRDIEAFDPVAESFDAILAMSILHLVDDRQAVIANAYKWLKPGGVFVSSTICLAEMSFFFPLLISAMQFVSLAPKVDRLKHTDLSDDMRKAGFVLEQEKRMSKGNVAFIVARKPA